MTMHASFHLRVDGVVDRWVQVHVGWKAGTWHRRHRHEGYTVGCGFEKDGESGSYAGS